MMCDQLSGSHNRGAVHGHTDRLCAFVVIFNELSSNGNMDRAARPVHHGRGEHTKPAFPNTAAQAMVTGERTEGGA